MNIKSITQVSRFGHSVLKPVQRPLVMGVMKGKSL